MAGYIFLGFILVCNILTSRVSSCYLAMALHGMDKEFQCACIVSNTEARFYAKTYKKLTSNETKV